MTVVNVPIERSPEAWLEKVAAPLVPEVREAALVPYKRQLGVLRSQGLSDHEIMRQWGIPKRESEKLQGNWPTLNELQMVAQAAQEQQLVPMLFVNSNGQNWLPRNLVAGSLILVAIGLYLNNALIDVSDGEQWCTIFIFLGLTTAFSIASVIVFNTLFKYLLKPRLPPFTLGRLLVSTGYGLLLGVAAGVSLATFYISEDWVTRSRLLLFIVIFALLSLRSASKWRKLPRYGITPDEALQKYASQPSGAV